MWFVVCDLWISRRWGDVRVESELVGNVVHLLHFEVLWSKGPWQEFVHRHLHIGAVRFGQVDVPGGPKLHTHTHMQLQRWTAGGTFEIENCGCAKRFT